MGGYDPETDESCVEEINTMIFGWIILGMGVVLSLMALGLAVGHFAFAVPFHNRNTGGTVSSAGVAILTGMIGLFGASMVAGGRYVLRRATNG
jgi:hypothetical protein